MLNVIKKLFTKHTTETLDTIDSVTFQTTNTVEGYVAPVRKSILKRFPTLFTLLVTFGVSATFLGVERLITEYKILNDSPELMLMVGVSILVFTGTLYKKLG